jgi:hypothetical protein
VKIALENTHVPVAFSNFLMRFKPGGTDNGLNLKTSVVLPATMAIR